MTFKCVVNILRTYVCFTVLEEGKWFCSKKSFTSRTLTGDEILLSLSMLLRLIQSTNVYTAIREQSDQYRRLHFTSQNTQTLTHTHTHIYIYICFRNYVLYFLRKSPSPLSEFAGSPSAMIRGSLIIKLHSSLFQATVMYLHSLILLHRARNSYLFLYSMIKTEIFSSECWRQSGSMM